MARRGAARPRQKGPEVIPALLSLVGPPTGGDPRGPTKVVPPSLPALSTELGQRGYSAGSTTVARLRRSPDSSPRSNAQRFTGPDHPDRDQQFQNIPAWIAIVAEVGPPIISVDAQTKELIGNVKNPGAVWGPPPAEVNVSDFLSDAQCRATPSGISDLLAGRGPVGVGTSADTPACAVAAIGTWWARSGCPQYQGADELLILADGGGSNGHRPRLWKARLPERIADRSGRHVTVCPYPTGASKWNPVEHRLFSPVSSNGAGQPLRSWEAMRGWVRGTEVGGAGVTASLDQAIDPTGVKVTNAEMRRLDRERHEVCPAWNSTISPRRPKLRH